MPVELVKLDLARLKTIGDFRHRAGRKWSPAIRLSSLSDRPSGLKLANRSRGWAED